MAALAAEGTRIARVWICEKSWTTCPPSAATAVLMSDWLAVGLNSTRINSVGPVGSGEAVALAVSATVAVAVAGAVGVALALGTAVGVAVAVAEAVAVRMAVAVAVGDGEGVAVAVAVEVGVDEATSRATVVGDASVGAAGAPALVDVVALLVCDVALAAVVLAGAVSAAATGTAAMGSTRLSTMVTVVNHDQAHERGVLPTTRWMSVSSS